MIDWQKALINAPHNVLHNALLNEPHTCLIMRLITRGEAKGIEGVCLHSKHREKYKFAILSPV
jgi:hypothetical protein